MTSAITSNLLSFCALQLNLSAAERLVRCSWLMLLALLILNLVRAKKESPDGVGQVLGQIGAHI